jgi:hypothetical protein
LKSLVGMRVGYIWTGCCEPTVKRNLAPSLLTATLVGLAFLTILLPSAYAAASSSSTTLYVLDPKLAHESTLACEALGGSWSNGTSTCTLSNSLALGSNNSITVEAGATLNITADLLVHSGSRLTNFGALIIRNGVQNHGIIDNYNEVIINSTGTIGPNGPHSGSIGNYGTINNHNGSTILNTRGLDNSGPSGTIVNNGTIINDSGDLIINRGHIKNHGSIINKGTINNVGNISNYGTIHNYNRNSSIYNIIYLFDPNSTVITNYDKGLIINSAGLIFNLGRIETQGRIDNGGLIDNYGPISNIGNITNNSIGVIINHNTGKIDNKGKVNNFGNVTTFYGAFNNGGSFQNDCGGVIYGAVSSGNQVMNSCTLTATTTIISITATTVTAPIERVESPTIYAWAIGATAIAAVLAAVALRRKS